MEKGKAVKRFFVCLGIICLGSGIVFGARQDSPKGEYLGQKKPGIVPEIFAPGFVSLEGESEFSCTLSPDGKEFYFARKVDVEQYTIFWTRRLDSGWTLPAPAPFSGKYFNHEPFISQDGGQIFWGSVRPLPDGKEDYSIWIMDRKGDQWTNLRTLGFNAMYVTQARNGTVYFTDRGRGGACLAYARFENGRFLPREVLGDPLLSDYWDGHPMIAPDESYLIFDSENRPGTEECGLFITFRKQDGSWTAPVHMREKLPKGRFAMLSPDEKYLFFSADGDIYWVDAGIIDHFRPDK